MCDACFARRIPYPPSFTHIPGPNHPSQTPPPPKKSDKLEENIANGERLVRAAAAQGAQVILLQELFAGPYFCQARVADWLAGLIDDLACWWWWGWGRDGLIATSIGRPDPYY